MYTPSPCTAHTRPHSHTPRGSLSCMHLLTFTVPPHKCTKGPVPPLHCPASQEPSPHHGELEVTGAPHPSLIEPSAQPPPVRRCAHRGGDERALGGCSRVLQQLFSLAFAMTSLRPVRAWPGVPGAGWRLPHCLGPAMAQGCMFCWGTPLALFLESFRWA